MIHTTLIAVGWLSITPSSAIPFLLTQPHLRKTLARVPTRALLPALLDRGRPNDLSSHLVRQLDMSAG